MAEKKKGWMGNVQGLSDMFAKQQAAASGYGSQAEKVLKNEAERNKQLKRIADSLEAIASRNDVRI